MEYMLPPKPVQHVLKTFLEPKNTSYIGINIFSSINIHNRIY